MIGALGSVVFEVSQESVRTFDDLKFSHSANYAEHSIHNSKSLLEFTSIKASSVSFTMQFNAHLGVNPQEELDKLHEIFNNHEAVSFWLGGKTYDTWVIESLDETHKIITNKGDLILAEVNIKLREYLTDYEEFSLLED